MRSARVRLAAFAAVGLVFVCRAPAREYLAVAVQAQVVAGDPERTSLSIATWADEVGGYFTYRSFEEVVVRLPLEHLGGLRQRIEELGDTVAAYDPSAEDLREELLAVEAGIAARLEAVERILAYLDGATVAATLAFERELRSLNQEVERYEGRRRTILNRCDYAMVRVVLSARRRTVPEWVPSSFAWVNTMGLYRFLADARTQAGSHE